MNFFSQQLSTTEVSHYSSAQSQDMPAAQAFCLVSSDTAKGHSKGKANKIVEHKQN